jgi:hypothetical protein
MSFNPISALAQGVLGALGNVPILGNILKPLTDALGGLFGGQQGAGRVQSAMDDYSNGMIGGDQLFNTVNGNLDSSALSDDGGPADRLKQFMAESKSGEPVNADQLMRLLQSLQASSNRTGGNIAPMAEAGSSSRAISF